MELKVNSNGNNKRPLISLENNNKKYIYIIMIFLIILSGFILVNNLSNVKEDSFLDTQSKGTYKILIK